jgi:hypothetical protein
MPQIMEGRGYSSALQVAKVDEEYSPAPSTTTKGG